MDKYDFYLQLQEKKLSDSIEFNKSCHSLLSSTKFSIDFVKELINNQEKERNKYRDDFYAKLEQDGAAYLGEFDNTIDFFGKNVSNKFLVDKFTIEVFSLLHNFFDIFAQWINAVLLAENGLLINDVSLKKLVTKLQYFPEYTGPFITKFTNILNDANYLYISDFNNTSKHRMQIYVKNQFEIFSGENETSIPEFQRNANIHSEKDLCDKLEEIFNYCKDLLTESEVFASAYYKVNENNYTSNRLHNPSAFLVFDNEIDYRNFSSLKNSIHYIDIDPINIKPEYSILLCRSRSDSKELELFNCPYDFIALRDKNTKQYIGILIPIDRKNIDINGSEFIHYQKYATKSTGYEQELQKKILEQEIKIFPYVTNIDIAVLKNE